MHRALRPHLDTQRIQPKHRVATIERTALPLLHFLIHGIGDAANELRRHLRAINLFQVLLHLAHAHTASVQGQHVVIEASKPSLVLGNHLRLKGTLSVPGNLQLQRPGAALHGLGRAAVSSVLAPLADLLFLAVQVKAQLRLIVFPSSFLVSY